jgi:HSP20 family protein
MAITRWEPFREIELWEPFREMESLQSRMNRLFERLMPKGDRLTEWDFMPSAEMEETENEIHLKLEIPGMEAKDLDIEVTETSVTISGDRKSESKTEAKGMVRSEFSYGKFERVIPLPVHIQNDKVKAEYKNGILTLTLPKTEAEKHKTVRVEVV